MEWASVCFFQLGSRIGVLQFFFASFLKDGLFCLFLDIVRGSLFSSGSGCWSWLEWGGGLLRKRGQRRVDSSLSSLGMRCEGSTSPSCPVLTSHRFPVVLIHTHTPLSTLVRFFSFLLPS